MKPIDAIKSVFNNYANFNGRARRSEYWWFFLFNIIIANLLAYVNLYLYGIYFLAIIIPSIAVAVRRMHDVNKSGWYCLIPIYNLILACTEGTKGDNEFGTDPKGGITSDELNSIGNN